MFPGPNTEDPGGKQGHSVFVMLDGEVLLIGPCRWLGNPMSSLVANMERHWAPLC